MENGQAAQKNPNMPPPKSWQHKGFWVVLLLGSAILFLYLLQLPALFDREWRNNTFEIGMRATAHKGEILVTRVQELDSRGDPTPAHRAEVLKGDIVTAGITEDGDLFPLHGSFSRSVFHDSVHFDRPWGLIVLRGDAQGALSEHVLLFPPAAAQPDWAQILLRFVGLKVLVPLLCIAVGLFIGLRRPDNPNAVLAALLLLSWTNMDPWRGYFSFPPVLLDITLFLSAALFSCLSYLFLYFCMSFPVDSPLKRKFPRLLKLLLPFPIVFTLWNIMWLYTMGYSYGLHHKIFQEWHLMNVDYVQDAIYVALFVLGFAALGWNIATTPSRDARRRAVTILVGFLGVLPCLVIYAWWTIVRTSRCPGRMAAAATESSSGRSRSRERAAV